MLTASENGTTTIATYVYNPLSQRLSLAYQAAADTMTYTWTTAGDMLTLAHNLGGASNDNTYTYTYYNSHQVATDAASIAAWKWLPTSCTTPPCTDSYAAANTLNQYPSVNGANLTYDTRGNLTGDGVWTYTYDAENRLLTAAKTGTNASFAYDSFGRRVKKTVGASTTYYLSNGDDEIAEYNSSGTVQYRYVPGPAIDDPIAMVAGTGPLPTVTYFHEDKTGSVVAMSGTTSALTEGPYKYDAYGNVSSTTGVPFKFTGRRYDPETGLYFYRARYYSAALGRFLQTDLVGYSAGMNLYAYTGNDPVNAFDPSGLASCEASRINTAQGSICADSNKDPNLSGSSASKEIKQAGSIGRALTEPYISQFAGNNRHDYEVGPTLGCEKSATCTDRNVSDIVHRGGIPFQLPFQEADSNGIYHMWVPLLGDQPISQRRPELGISINYTWEGHRYHPGVAVHATYEFHQKIWFYTRGAGIGPHARENQVVGPMLFGVIHFGIQKRVQMELVIIPSLTGNR